MSFVLPLRVAAGMLLALALFSLFRSFSRSRSAPYFLLRRAATVRAWRWFLAALGAGVLLAATFWVRLPARLIPANVARPTSVAGLPVTIGSTPPPTVIEQPSEARPNVTTTLASQATGVPTASATSSTATPSPLIATRDSTVTPLAEARISITAISTGITTDFLPANAGTAFSAGSPRFYIFYDFEAMSEGVSWSGVVLVDGQIDGDVSFDELWTTGQQGENLYRWFDRDEGWPIGEYEIRVYIGDQLADTASFRMVEGPDATLTQEATP